jgi:hypothetical protein
MSSPIVLTSSQWTPSAIRYMQPKVNDRGGKAITIISTQSNRSLYVTLPMMLTWGISDYTDEKTGESDGKYTMSIQFPREMDRRPETDQALEKMKAFEEQILTDAVKNSEAWFGKKQSREIVEYGYFSFLKYSKNKDTQEVDTTKAPSMRPKVPCYEGKWKVEVYDTQSNMLFPSENEDATPMEFVPKRSNVICMIQCGGIWVGGKGWGVTWKLTQCVVKPQVMETVFGRCNIMISDEVSQEINKEVDTSKYPEPPAEGAVAAVAAVEDSTYVEDSDEEESVVKAPEPVAPEPVPVPVVSEPVTVPEAEAEAPKKKTVKKVVKKTKA